MNDLKFYIFGIILSTAFWLACYFIANYIKKNSNITLKKLSEQEKSTILWGIFKVVGIITLPVIVMVVAILRYAGKYNGRRYRHRRRF